MKIHGKRPASNVVTLVLPRGEEEIIVVRAQAVLDYKEFDAIFPKPEPPVKILRGGIKSPDFEAQSYVKHMEEYGQARTRYMILKSLQAWDGLEWEKVVLADPNTWGLWETELSEAGFSEIEKQRILGAVMEANSLNESKLEEARERFLSGKLREKLSVESGSQNGEAKIMPSGEPANVSESVPQAS